MKLAAQMYLLLQLHQFMTFAWKKKSNNFLWVHISFPLSHFLKPLFPVHDSTLLLACGFKHQKMTQIIYLMFSWKMDTWAFIPYSVTTPPAGFHLCVLIPTGSTFAPLLFTLVNLNVINQSNQECKTQLFAVKHSDCSLHLVTHSWLSYSLLCVLSNTGDIFNMVKHRNVTCYYPCCFSITWTVTPPTIISRLIFLVHGLYCKISGNKYQCEIVGLSQKYQVKSVKLPHMKLWNHQLFCMLAWKKSFLLLF